LLKMVSSRTLSEKAIRNGNFETKVALGQRV